MQFQTWFNVRESSLSSLYQSAVAAFPGTTKRQHATDLVRITELQWTPYLGMKTLFIRGLAQSEESGKEYMPIVVFKDVQYHPSKEQSNWVEIIANDGKQYTFEKLNHADNDVLVRCNCPDFSWRFNYYNHLDNSLYGRKRTKYEAISNRGPANPFELPGMCKHLMKLVKSLDHAGILEG